jgi:formylglycine-generating enzyme required for sulfatase activity
MTSPRLPSEPDHDHHAPLNSHGPTEPSIHQIQSGGVNLGAYNHIEQIGNIIADSTINMVVYTGPTQSLDTIARFSLEQAYRSEVAARYAIWRNRYVWLPFQATRRVGEVPTMTAYEREDMVFAALRRMVTEPPYDQQPICELHTFTDLREGLNSLGDLLLLGAPGSGKTTALWRLALDLAEDGLYRAAAAPLPIFVRLGGFAEGQSLLGLLQQEIAGAALESSTGRRFPLEAHRKLAPLLPELIEDGRLVLLWDGLNEVPQTLFETAAREVEAFCRNYTGPLSGPHTRSVITCRADDYALLIEACGGNDPLSAQQSIIQSLDQQTIRQIIIQRLGDVDGLALLSVLAQPQQRELAALARTPLLLTMLCEVFASTGSLPTNRGVLLQAFVAQRWAWEQQRHADKWIATDLQERALAQLAFAIIANRGRGTSVPWEWARKRIHSAGPQIDPERVRTLACQADLLEMLNEGQAIRFSHQLFQEYFAARALHRKLEQAARLRQLPLLSRYGQVLLNRYVASGRRTNWEETVLLLAGIEGENGIAYDLVHTFLGKPLEAARLLKSSGADVDLALLEETRRVALDQLADDQRMWDERIAAGRALALVGDPRFPVTYEEWVDEVHQCNVKFGQPTGYWCYVRPHSYRIGGWRAKDPAATIEIDAFWIAKLPVTVIQFASFVSEGYNDRRWWTHNGWQWKCEEDRIQPWAWDDQHFNHPNQPVTNVTWYEAAAFAAWLNARLDDVLPKGHIIRLPTEAEWEVAAAYDAGAMRRSYPWGQQRPSVETAIYDESGLDAPAPVGCCPAGTAPCGALDLVGNVYEAMTSHRQGYPDRSYILVRDFIVGDYDVPWRGGSYWHNITHARCAARIWSHPKDYIDYFGLRLVMALHRAL